MVWNMAIQDCLYTHFAYLHSHVETGPGGLAIHHYHDRYHRVFLLLVQAWRNTITLDQAP